MNITVNEELLAYIDPLTPEENEALERSLLAEGCRDALVLWGEVLVDGHNRHRICTQHGIPFNTVQNTRFTSIDDVHLWMIEQHLGRRSVSDFQRGVLALRRKDILTARMKPATLPREAQVAAVAGGKKELQQAARQVRESQAVARTEPETPEGVIARLRQTITELSAENAALKAKLAELTF